MSPPPDPAAARSFDDFTALLRALKIWAGDPSYGVIKDRITAAWRRSGRPSGEAARKSKVADCFRSGRRRLNTDLVLAVVAALHEDPGYVAQWQQVLRILTAETTAGEQVRAQDTLPCDVPAFTGRGAQVRTVERLAGRTGREAVVVAVEGMAGVGKTQLAVHAAHRLLRAERFEQVLFVNLRGVHSEPDQPPADPAAVLDSFLRLLRLPGPRIPHDLAGRAAAFRAELTGRRVLILLDNAADESQVRPLLVDVPDTLTLVTSRRRLALDQAVRLPLAVFTRWEARRFLAAAAPGLPVGEDAKAVDRLVTRCGHLPLALGLVAGQMRARDGWTLTDHADRLDERHRRGRLDTEVEITLDLSYRNLTESRQRLFRALAVHPGDDLDDTAAAALADVTREVAGEHLTRLTADHLLHRTAPGRFGFHDLVRAYAIERAAEEDRVPARRDALGRLCDYYLAAAGAAMDRLVPAERHVRPGPPATTTAVRAFPDAAVARRWLDEERTNLVAVACQAATRGWTERVTRMAAVLFRYLDVGNHYQLAITLHTCARNAARADGDRAGEAQAATNLGTVRVRQGAYLRAVEHLRNALDLIGPDGDRLTLARVVGNLGVAQERLGRFAEAAAQHQRALDLFGEIGDRLGQARALTNLGIVCERLGRYPEAIERHERALVLSRELGDHIAEASSLDHLGYAYRRTGDHRGAIEHHRRSLALTVEAGNRSGQAAALNNLGASYHGMGRHEEAVRHQLGALALLRDLGDSTVETETLNDLGETLLAGGRSDRTGRHHAEALALAERIGDRYQQGRAHNGLAHVRLSAGDPAGAACHWEKALALYDVLDVPEADAVRDRLATLDRTG